MTESAWSRHFVELRRTSSGKSASARLNQFRPANQVVAIEVPYTEAVMRNLSSIQQEKEWIINRKTVEASRLLDPSGTSLGLFVKTECTAVNYVVSIAWTIDPDASIRSVRLLDKSPGDDLKEAFSNLEGLTLEKIHHCSTAGQLAAGEVLAISEAHLRL